MKTFRFTADFEFAAENIDDACAKLSQHFYALAGGDLDSPLDIVGSLSLAPPDEPPAVPLQYVSGSKPVG